MELISSWLQSVVADFRALTPTAQVTFFIGGLTFSAACLVGVIKVATRLSNANTANVPEVDSETESARILRLIEAGEVSTQDALELARLLYGGSSEPVGTAGEAAFSIESQAQSVSTLTSGDDDRIAFIETVKEYATSKDANDRAVILQYARGDRSAAIATLMARAQAAGKEGAEIWREVATLALPFNHASAVTALERAAELDVKDVVSLCRLSGALARTGEMTAAKKAAENALSRAEDDSLRGRALCRLAVVCSKLGDTGQAAKLAKEAVDAAKKGAAVTPSDQQKARVLANAYEVLSSTQVALGSHIEANATLDKAVKLYDHLLKFAPDDEEIILDRFRGVTTQGYLDKIAGNPAAAVARFDALIPEIKQAMANQPQNLWFAESCADAMAQRSFALNDLGRFTDAMEAAFDVEKLSEELIKEDRAQLGPHKNRLWAQILRIRIMVKMGRLDEAAELRDAMIRRARKDVSNDTDDQRRTLATVLTEDADLRKELGDDLGAEENYKEAYAITQSIADGDPDDISKREDVLFSAWKLAAFAQSQNDVETFRNIAADTLADAENLLKEHPSVSKLKFDVAYAQRVMAHASFNNNDRDAFLRYSEASCAGYAALVRANPENFENCSHELYSRLVHAEGLADIGRGKVAMARIKEVLADLETLGDTREKAGRLSGQKSACLRRLSAIHSTFGDFDAAHAAHLEALEIVRARYEEAPAITARRANFVLVLTEYGDLLKAANRTEDARTCYQEALDLCSDRSNATKQTEQTNRLVALSRLGNCANAMGNSELAGQYRAECLGIVEAQAEEERNYTAQSNLSKAYLAEATESMRVGQWVEADTWIAKAKEVARKVTGPKDARQLQQRLANAELEIALHKGDKAESRKYIDILVAMAAENEAEQSTLNGQLNLCDLLIRQASLHDEYGQDNPIIQQALAALTAAESYFASNELARSSLVSIWERMGHLYESIGQLSNAIAAFEKALALRSQEDLTEKPLGVANTRIALSKVLFAADDIDRAQEELAKVEALIPVIRNFYDLPRFAIFQEYEVAHIGAAIAMFSGDMAQARERASKAEAAANALETELPNHGDPFFRLFNAIDHEIEALWIEQAMDRAEPIYERLYEMSERVEEIFANDRVAGDIRGYLALVRSRIDNAAGKHAEALKSAQDGVKVIQRNYDSHATAFRKANLGRLRSSAANAYIALGDVESALAFQRDAVADFEFVNLYAPEVKENARRHLRSLFDLARLTDDEDCFDQVALQKRNLEETGSLPKHYFWVEELDLEERLTIRVEGSNL